MIQKSLKGKKLIERDKIKTINVKSPALPHSEITIVKHSLTGSQTVFMQIFFNKDGLTLCIRGTAMECDSLRVNKYVSQAAATIPL